MGKKKATAAAAAAAECHYQSGRFSQAAIEIQRCCDEEGREGLLLDDDVGIIITTRRVGKSSEDGFSCGKSNDGITDDRKIILATDDDSNYEESGNDYSFHTSSHTNTKSATENDNNIRRMELIALSPLAHRADLAMCQFRSVSSSDEKLSAANNTSTNDTSTMGSIIHDKINSTSKQSSSTLEHLWKRAKQTNHEYRTALRGAAISLFNTASTLHPNRTNLSSENNKGGGQCVSIINAMKSTALAILMAGVAASHLYLHHHNNIVDDCNSEKKKSCTDNDDDYDQRSTNYGNDNAWRVLVHSAAFAADVMISRREFIRRYNDNTAIDDDGNDVATTTSATRSILEESIHILNETLFTATNANTINSNMELETERDSMAMQSFRTALKVAALACGKVILPTVVVEGVGGDTDEVLTRRSHPPQKKRQKSEVTPNNTADTSNSEVWSVAYNTHSNPLLQSRERIVDGLSFHYAATNYLCDEAKLQNRRMICLEEGRMWEEQSSCAVFGRNDTSSSSTTTTTTGGGDGWCAGYAWKIKHCLQGLDLASSSSSSSQFSSFQDVRTIQSLEKMALSSSSRFACDLLGCIYAKRGEVPRALELFQSSLEHASSVDSDEEFAQKRTLVNMALCFLALGEAHPPLELLLHLWMTSSRSNSLIGTRPRPFEMLLSSDTAKVGVNGTARDKSVDQCNKELLLWMLFYASSLAQDWATCLNCTEEMMNASLSPRRVGAYADVSRVFALLQCRRPSTAQELIRNLIATLMRMKNSADNNSAKPASAELLLVATQLYHADAYLLQERSSDHTGGEEDTPLNFIQRANKFFSVIVSQVDASSSLLIELQILMANDQGVALVIEGDSVGALGNFRKATQLLKSTLSTNGRKGLQHLPWLLIPTFFNLSLILLRDGHLEESARSWLLARKYLPCWENAIRGDNESLKKLRDSHTVAINRHVILMAKRGMQRETAVWDQENVMEWVPPSFEAADVNEEQSSLVGGVDASQVIALDVILLRYAISFAEKKAAASFRRSAGSIGY
jgi:tetratricopeptide (TPR) repeat protein